MKDIVANKMLIAYCGLYCGACSKYLNGKCPGCRETTSAAWCKIRPCNQDAGTFTCADCTQMALADCKKYNNPVAKIIGFVLRSDRKVCLTRIKALGAEGFAQEMTQLKAHTLKKGAH